MLANNNTPTHERLWCVYEAFLVHRLAIRTRIVGDPMHLLTGNLRRTLQTGMNARAARQEQTENAQNSGPVTDAVLMKLEEAKDKEDEAKRSVLAAEDDQLINLDTAKCTMEADERRIREAIRNDKGDITALVAGMIRDMIKVESPELRSVVISS